MVLSPVLLTIYTDGLRSGSSQSSVIKFVDDTVILGHISDTFTGDLKYFNEVSRVSNICSENDLKLNATKTHEMVFTTQRETLYVPILSLNGVAIPQSSSVKYLGVIIDDKLKFH